MKAESVKKSNIAVVIGLLLQLGGLAMILSAATAHWSGGQTLAGCGLALVVVSIVMLVAGCMHYAEAKGYSGVWGAIALLNIWGLLILYILPDKLAEQKPVSSDKSEAEAA